MTADLCERITDQIIEAIEAGVEEYRMPWHGGTAGLKLPRNVLTDQDYSGINILSLWAAALGRGYDSPLWGTYRQWAELGFQVKKGERSTTGIRVLAFEREDEDDRDDEDRKVVLRRRGFSLFNVAQVDGFDGDLLEAASGSDLGETGEDFEENRRVDDFMARTGAEIRHGGDRAYYSLAGDYIQMPEKSRFYGSDGRERAEAYFSCLLHEAAHWSAGPGRLEREFGKRFGDEAYAAEELVVEIAAAVLCAKLGVSATPRADHASYVAHWLKILRGDKMAIFHAAGKAQEACDYLESLQDDHGSQAA